MIPLVRTLKTYDRATLRSDLLAGLTTAIMLVPQGMAYAMLAGLDPIVGLYAATVPIALYALFGTSRSLAVGPVAMDSILVATAIAPIAIGDPIIALAAAGLLAIMVGITQVTMGLARLGLLVRYLANPVIAGFTSAAALIIGSSQLTHLLGVPLPRSQQIHVILIEAAKQLPNTSGITVIVALIAIAALLSLKRFAPQVPRFLLVVVVGVLAVWGLGLHDSGVAIVGSVPAGLPSLTVPAWDPSLIRTLLPSALTLALIGFMESISIAKLFAAKHGTMEDANQELKALGLANIGAGLFNGYPVAGGFSRSAVNEQAGAKTPLAGLFSAALVTVTLLFLTPLFHFLPKAVLAAIIMTAVLGLINIAEAKRLWATHTPDFWLMTITFVGTLAMGIQLGLAMGIAVSLLMRWWPPRSPAESESNASPAKTAP